MMQDWKDALLNLKGSGTLPEGEDTAVQTPAHRATAKKDNLHVVVEKKGRKGKVATIIEGFTISDEEVAVVAKMLKSKLGVGGSSRGGEILVQGDCSQKVTDLLRAAGYKVK